MSGRAWIVFGVMCAAIALTFTMAVYHLVDVPTEIRAGAVMKLSTDKGHGSAVHIGSGYILSAAHVLPDGVTELTAKLDDDTEHKAEVLWRNDAHDIALLRLPTDIRPTTATLACRLPDRDEAVIADGNPLALERIKTRGYIAGTRVNLGRWRSVVPMDIAIAGGMSGGALFDHQGYLIGILVGAPVQAIGMGGSFVGMAFAVPGDTVCHLLARV